MTLKIETQSDGNKLTIRLSGRMREECIQALKALLDDATPEAVLNLGDVSLVGVEVVRFLADCEKAGVALIDCPRYIRDWIDREQAKHKSERLTKEE